MSRSRFFCFFFYLHDAVATRGQYLALSKAWLSFCSCYRCQDEIVSLVFVSRIAEKRYGL